MTVRKHVTMGEMPEERVHITLENYIINDLKTQNDFFKMYSVHF